MLNPSTKEIAKIESKKIQKVELIRWDVATKLQIYASGNNTDLIFKNIRRRPMINPIHSLEGTQPLEILQTRLNKAHQEYQQTAQTIYNENMKNELEFQENERFRQLEESMSKMIQLYAVYITNLD